MQQSLTVLDQLLQAIHAVHVAVLVDVEHVSGLKVSVRREGLLRALWILIVTLEHIRSLDPQFANLPI